MEKVNGVTLTVARSLRHALTSANDEHKRKMDEARASADAAQEYVESGGRSSHHHHSYVGIVLTVPTDPFGASRLPFKKTTRGRSSISREPETLNWSKRCHGLNGRRLLTHRPGNSDASSRSRKRKT